MANFTYSIIMRLLLLLLVAVPSWVKTIIVFAQDDKTNGGEGENKSLMTNKSYRICSVQSGLELTRLTSTSTRNFFQGAIDDVELMREYVTEAMHNGGLVNGLHDLDDLAATFDWQARGFTQVTTSIDANLGWADDRVDRRVERFVSLANEPLIGSKAADMAMVDTLSSLLPWIVDRKSVESSWWLDHQNGRSEGEAKQKFRFNQLYTAAWIQSYGEATLYYPPLRVFGHPFTLAEVLGPLSDTREYAFVSPNLPENNPTRQATFSAPYPDTAVPGLSLITAMAPLYYTGEWYGYTYTNTYIASVGVDIAIASVSSLLEELEGTLTKGSFAFLVDSEFHMIVISQATVGKIYPPRTGFEESRVTYNVVDGSITEDRRNQTYLPSDTILQDLSSLSNADWIGLQSRILELNPGAQGYEKFNVTLTGETDPSSYYVMYERWPDVGDFVLLALVPVSEVDQAIDVKFLDPAFIDVSLGEDEMARSVVTFANEGTLDVMVTLLDLPSWIQLLQVSPIRQVVEAGDTLKLEFDILGDELELGTTSTLVALSVEDAHYPDCSYSHDLSFEVTVLLESTSHWFSEIGVFQVLVFLAAALSLISLSLVLYFQKKHNRDDTIWKVQKKDLIFDEPPEIIGRGTFGLILKAEYRGTQVAVKRVMPAKRSGTGDASTDGDSKSGLGEGSKSGTYGTKSLSSGSKSMSGGASSSTGKMTKKLRSDFKEEMRYLSKLRHPCITTVMGAIVNSVDEPMLVMEYMEYGSLHDILHNETMPIDGELLLPILRDISQGMRFLHAAEHPVIHGDLKAANILVDSKFRAKVADFGLSQKEHLGGTGTPFWMAPELLRGESTNTAASDVYSFGIILYEVYSRRDPYEGEIASEVLRLVADKTVNKRPPVPKDCPAQVQSLMTDSLVMDPAKRPSFREVDERLKRVDVETIVNPSPLVKGASRNATISLFDIFPKHIAEALRDGKKVEPEHKECVTIFFCDIIGFTDISTTLDPRKVANMLDRLYNKFDELSHNHDVFKVETIGDAYMVCTNLTKDQSNDHVKRVAEFAVDAIQAANTTLIDTEDPDRGFVNIRVGFHSGPVVADVVGSRNPRYCLFGDTVNTASRMESASKVNSIHCSGQAAELLQEQHPTMPILCRGKIKVKGKGEMTTFWVNEGSTGVTAATTTTTQVSSIVDTIVPPLEQAITSRNVASSPVPSNTNPITLPSVPRPVVLSAISEKRDGANPWW